MGIFTGLPDFGRPEMSGVVAGYAAYEQPGVVIALPTGLSPAPVEGDSVPLQVDLYQQERDGAITEFGLVVAAFVVDVPLDPHHRDDRPTVVARPASLGEGILRLTAPADLGVPAAALLPRQLDAAVGIALPTIVKLDGVGAELVAGALRAGLRTLGANAWVTVRGLATRCSGTLEVDVDTLVAALGTAPLAPEALEQRAADGIPGVTVTGAPDDPRLVGAAVLDRITMRLAGPALPKDPAGEGGWQFAGSPSVGTTMSWDLSAPIAAQRLLRLTCEPVVGPSAEAAVVRRHTSPRLTDGREQVTVYTTIPAAPSGVVAATVRLIAPPAAPDRPFAAEATARLAPPSPSVATLVLAPGEALAYDLTGSAVLETGAGPRAAVGTSRRVVGDSTPVVTPADLGIRLLAVHATPELLDLADVTVRATATWDGTTVACAATLRPGAAVAWLALPRDAETPGLVAEATTRGTHPATVRQELPVGAVWLDPYSFEDPPWQGPAVTQEPPLTVEVAGLRVVGRPGEVDWRFLPLTAGPVRDAGGAPQLSLLEAGGTAILVVTTALLVSDSQQEQARIAVTAAGAGADVRLSPAPYEVQEVALLVLRGGGLAVIAATTASGTATQDAAFAVTLEPADRDAVGRALGGEAGVVVVRYSLAVSAGGAEASALLAGATSVVVLTDASTWPD